MSDEKEPAVDGVPNAPDAVPYQTALIIAVDGEPFGDEHLELIAKMEALVDAIRKRFPHCVFESKITDAITGTPERNI